MKLYITALLIERLVGLNLKGADPEKEHLYRVPELTCPGNESKKLTPDMINDDFCDCPEDGFDEPGTSACAAGTFFCKNEGYFPKNIKSMYINDGVCDCCDGSDETDIKCPNTCVRLRKEHDEKEAGRVAMLEKGLKAKSELVLKAKDIKTVLDRQIHMGRLDVQALTKQLSILKEIKPMEPSETSYDQAFHDDQEKWNRVQDIFAVMRDSTGCKACDLALDQFDKLTGNRVDRDENDHLGRTPIELLMSDSVVGESTKKTIWESLKRLDFSELRNMLKQYRATKTVTVTIPATATGIVQQVSPIDDLEKKLRESEARLKKLEEKVVKDYGPDNIFLALAEECVEFVKEKYTYKLFFFGKITQTETKAKFNEVSLGEWSNWEQKDGKSDHTKMIYTDGLFCWNGPQRHTDVILECGPENAIMDVSEPSVCEYVMRVKTPAIC